MTYEDTGPLIEGIQLTQLDKYLFSGQPNAWPSGHVYGGHVLAQSMEAAMNTVSDSVHFHSMHAYFLRQGKAGRPIVYEVDPIRDGGSFCTRRVVAIQDGVAIFNTSLSFHKKEEGFSHQVDNVYIDTNPDDYEDDETFYKRHLTKRGLDADKLFPSLPFILRTLDRVNPDDPQPLDPNGGTWVKLKNHHPLNTDANIRMLCYASDFGLMSACLRPHGMLGRDPRIGQMASLDHAFYLHDDDFDCNDWLFYKTEGNWAGGARVFSRGTFYTREGKMIASTTQEGLVRPKRK